MGNFLKNKMFCRLCIVVGILIAIILVKYIYQIMNDKKIMLTNGTLKENNIGEINCNSYQVVRENIRQILVSDMDKTIVIDPGHGGHDPGKVGVHNELEKDINLEIAYRLKDKLIKSGFSVIMTRTKDEALNDIYDKNKKMGDLRKRIEIINTSGAICLVSIHQNSFTSEREKGAQVFFYGNSEMSKDLACGIQDRLKVDYDENNTRKYKSNNSYYLLKKSCIPSIIVECGFLSNEYEASMLVKKACQEEIAQAINNGIIMWANGIIGNK